MDVVRETLRELDGGPDVCRLFVRTALEVIEVIERDDSAIDYDEKWLYSGILEELDEPVSVDDLRVALAVGSGDWG